METLKIRVSTIAPMLGTTAGNSKLVEEYIASKAADCKTADYPAEEKAAEEVEAVKATLAEVVEEDTANAMTIFPKHKGVPFIWDYQFKGFLKEACMAVVVTSGQYTKEQQKKLMLTHYTYKRTIDNLIFVGPRKIMLDASGPMEVCQRPLRAQTMRGERIALAISESLPAGTVMDLTITILNKIHVDVIKELLNYGKLKGLLQWRNAGHGAFVWQEIA